jgi:tetratricopeptide (TPR) repeat protein
MAETAIEQALSLHQSGDLDAAEQAYLDIVTDDSQNAEALKLLGVLACQRGKFDDGINYLEAAIQIDDTVAEYHFALGQGYVATGKVEDGIKAMLEAGRVDPARADIYGAIGDTFQQIHNFPEALRAYQRAIALDSKNVNYKVGAGLTAIFSSQLDMATEYLEEVISERDNIPHAFYGLALIKAESGDTQAAHDLISKSVALDGNNPEYQRLKTLYAES